MLCRAVTRAVADPDNFFGAALMIFQFKLMLCGHAVGAGFQYCANAGFEFVIAEWFAFVRRKVKTLALQKN
ncbi:MAG TPA: hypothetical protein DDX57_03050 [Bacteroidales bacterium]|nr:MAG: hypothetical protein A2W94_00060 [Bacteroidetes bacterium GWE2_42_42]HBG69747.1 hypothetical protein [Bacteroidales bacterium]HCB61123.1 hypothetical protein [Bacteroidales bacterium]